MELRRKNKPTPAEITPPSDPEEWIARANADGEPLQVETVPDKPARRPTTKVRTKQPESQEKREKQKQILPPTPAPSAGSRYISFAIDSLTLSRFRDLSFTLDKGNTATLAHIIVTCARMREEEFLRFPESQVVIGNTKRTMSFLMPCSALDDLNTLALRLRFRNKSALCRYLIQLNARHFEITR
ncbi:MAG TPA: hypothetical protein PK176_06865 [Acidobacteriota bacterium]|nr:hypothetical protein [Acidobacteriota bacterium]